ncbi:hypothetical protein FIBSPDRAFT_878604 [Athelia psychrophila]|uniref:Uncharacterized protein n=1 Tax=Athelia psychrophila TaxID=1759441 RepID=A0A167UVN5_9AGAM|nr:hypothetical protein FIBSPDRAFT_878604 [Fibularhizoctonia sp. CBS 109695]
MDRASQSNIANISIPMENINPLLQDFVVSYRALLNCSMFNAFGWTAPHRPHTPGGPACFCEARREHRVLFITIRAVPNLSPATKGRAAFLVEDAEALTIDEFREAAENGSHRLYHEGNMQHLEAFDRALEEFSSAQGPIRRASMCFMSLTLSPRASFLKKSIHGWSHDRSSDHSSGWNPDDWLQHLKEEVGKGEGWEPPCPLPGGSLPRWL